FEIFDGVVARDAAELTPGLFAGDGVLVEPKELGLQAAAGEGHWPGLVGTKPAEAERRRSLIIERDRIEGLQRVDPRIAAAAAAPLRREDRAGDHDQAARLLRDPPLQE